MEIKFILLLAEIVLLLTACCVMILGQSKHKDSRNLAPAVCGIGLVLSLLVHLFGPNILDHILDHDLSLATLFHIKVLTTDTALPQLHFYGKIIVILMGLVMLPLMAGTVDRDLEAGVNRGKPFEALRSTRGEFYSFFLFSLTGVMLSASADDLILLFLALELTSLPTYVMVALSTARNRSMEAGVKYFFLGALGAAVFLYGFALIYGATGSTNLHTIASTIGNTPGPLNGLALLGVVLAVLGVCFKIAAVPMHFYTPDVYQGASASVAGFLAFVPKAAGFFAIMLLCSLVGWRWVSDVDHPAFALAGNPPHLPESLRVMLWVIAVMTMTAGNVLAILQHSVKRILAYSSIAHSGYMLVGIIAGPGPEGSSFTRNGLAAVLFYLAAYGIMTIGAFAVVACLDKKGEEADDIEDLRGLALKRPLLGWTMVLSAMGLLGLPPLLGFFGKVPLFTAGIGAGEIPLVIILGVNSAIAAYYYLRFAYVCFIEAPESLPSAAKVEPSPAAGSRHITGVLSMAGVTLLVIVAGSVADFAARGGAYRPAYIQKQPPSSSAQPEETSAPPQTAAAPAVPAADEAGLAKHR
jgi:NADH-quinone oxidoreductase subunit N